MASHSTTISAVAGIGRPVYSPMITGTGEPCSPPTQSYSETPRGTSIPSAIQFVPLRRGKLPHVDVFAFEDVLQYRSIFDDFGLNVIDFSNVAFDVLDEIKPRVVRVHVQRCRDALHRVQRITKDTITLRV